jgi:hypothetical protein
MKSRILVGAVVLLIAGAVGWYITPSPTAAPAKTADAPASAASSASKPASASIPASPERTAQVAAPVVAPAIPKAAPATPSPAAAAAEETFVAGPQADLKTCISTTIHFLQTQDVASLVKTIMPPDAIQQMIQSGQASSIDDIAAHYAAMPDVPEKMNQLLEALQSVQGQDPEMSADGNTATYTIDNKISGPGKPPPPAGTPGDITFVKVNGFWYLR